MPHLYQACTTMIGIILIRNENPKRQTINSSSSDSNWSAFWPKLLTINQGRDGDFRFDLN